MKLNFKIINIINTFLLNLSHDFSYRRDLCDSNHIRHISGLVYNNLVTQ